MYTATMPRGVLAGIWNEIHWSVACALPVAAMVAVVEPSTGSTYAKSSLVATV